MKREVTSVIFLKEVTVAHAWAPWSTVMPLRRYLRGWQISFYIQCSLRKQSFFLNKNILFAKIDEVSNGQFYPCYLQVDQQPTTSRNYETPLKILRRKVLIVQNFLKLREFPQNEISNRTFRTFFNPTIFGSLSLIQSDEQASSKNGCVFLNSVSHAGVLLNYRRSRNYGLPWDFWYYISEVDFLATFQ